MNFSILILLCITPSLLSQVTERREEQSITENTLTRTSSNDVGNVRNGDVVQSPLSYIEMAQEKYRYMIGFIPFLSKMSIWKRLGLLEKYHFDMAVLTFKIKMFQYFLAFDCISNLYSSWPIVEGDLDKAESNNKLKGKIRNRLTPVTEVEIPAPSIQSKIPTVALKFVLTNVPTAVQSFTVHENACVLCIISRVFEIQASIIDDVTRKFTHKSVFVKKEEVKYKIAVMFKYINDTNLGRTFDILYQIYKDVDESAYTDEEHTSVSFGFSILNKELLQYLNSTFRMSWYSLFKPSHTFSDYVTFLKKLLSGQPLDGDAYAKLLKFLDMCFKLMLISINESDFNRFKKTMDDNVDFRMNEKRFLELINFAFTSSLVTKKGIKSISKKVSFNTEGQDGEKKNAGAAFAGKLKRGVSNIMRLNERTPSALSTAPIFTNANEGSTFAGIERTASIRREQSAKERLINDLILQHFNTILCVFDRLVTLTTGITSMESTNEPDQSTIDLIGYIFQEYIEILEWTREFESMTDEITGINESQKYVEAFINTFAYYTLQFRSVINACITEFKDEKTLITDSESLLRVGKIVVLYRNDYLDHILFPSENLVEAAKKYRQLRFDSKAYCKTLKTSINFDTLNVIDLNAKPDTTFKFSEEMDAIKLQRMNSQLSLKNLLQFRTKDYTDSLIVNRTIQGSALSILYPVTTQQ